MQIQQDSREWTSPGDQSVSAIIGATAGEHYSEDFYGSASAGNFLQMVKNLVKHKLPREGQLTPTTSGRPLDHPLLAASPQENKEAPLDYILPSRRQADHLMTTYWKDVHLLYPFLDEIDTRADYDKIWSSASLVSNEKSFLCLLNVIFAISSQLTGPIVPGERDKAAASFYHRCYALLNVLDAPSVRSVQTYLLLGFYFQSTNEPHACWVFVGMSIRTAQSLGLHLPQTTERISDIRSRETLRRVWYGCVLMDRVLSMTYGRPCMIGPQTAIAVPLPHVADERPLVHGQTRQTDDQIGQPSGGFYVTALKLYEILHDVLFNFYRTDVQTQSIDEVYDKCFGSSTASVFEIDRRLTRWEESLPDHLDCNRQSQQDLVEPLRVREAVILRQKQLHIRLLLLRPVLSHFVHADLQSSKRREPDGSNSLTRRTFLQCAIVCVKAAQEAINVICNNKSQQVGEIGHVDFWWYNVLFLYTSATVLIAARLSRDIQAEVSEDSLLDSWRTAIGVLEEYGTFNTSIRLLIGTLNLLFDAVPRQYSRLKTRPQTADANIASLSNENAAENQPPLGHLTNSNESAPSLDLLSTGGIIWDSAQAPQDFFDGFDFNFDPNDLSWLTSVPVNS